MTTLILDKKEPKSSDNGNFPPFEIEHGDSREPPFEYRPEFGQRIFQWLKPTDRDGGGGLETLGINVIQYVLNNDSVTSTHVSSVDIPSDPRLNIEGRATLSMGWTFSEHSPNWGAFESALRMSALGSSAFWQAVKIDQAEKFKALDDHQFLHQLLNAALYWGSAGRQDAAFEVFQRLDQLDPLKNAIREKISLVTSDKHFQSAQIALEQVGRPSSNVDKVYYQSIPNWSGSNPGFAADHPDGHTIRMSGSATFNFTTPLHEFCQDLESVSAFERLASEEQLAVFSVLSDMIELEIASSIAQRTAITIEYTGRHIPASMSGPEEFPYVNYVTIEPLAHEVLIEDVGAYEAPMEGVAEILASIPMATLAKYRPLLTASLKLTGVYHEKSEGYLPLYITAISADKGALRFSCRLSPDDLY